MGRTWEELFHPEYGSMENEEYIRWRAFYVWEDKRLAAARRAAK